MRIGILPFIRDPASATALKHWLSRSQPRLSQWHQWKQWHQTARYFDHSVFRGRYTYTVSSPVRAAERM